MNNDDGIHNNGMHSDLPDTRQSGLQHDLDEWLRTHDEREDIHEQKLNERLNAHRQHIRRKNRQVDLVEQVEIGRLGKLMTARSVLESEITAAHEVAAKALAMLGLEYVPGETSVKDVYAIARLHESEAADRAGVAGVHGSAMGTSSFIKWAGMAGCFVLATIGMGAMVMQVPPKQLPTNPVALIVSMGLACVIVGGVYMMVHPTWKRIGTMAGSGNEEKTRKAIKNGILVSALAVISVASIDAKAILAINAPKALVDPEHATPLWVAFLTGCCLSSVYVIGTSIVAYNDAYGAEAGRRIEAEQRKHERAEVDDQRNYVEVRNAIEALNNVAVLERNRAKLDPQVEALQKELKQAFNEHYEDIPEAPDMPEEHKADLRMHKKHAKFAEWKVQAHEALKRLNPNSDGGKS